MAESESRAPRARQAVENLAAAMRVFEAVAGYGGTAAAELELNIGTSTVSRHVPFPLTIERGEDAYIWDCDGHRYVDFLGDFTSGLYGHTNSVIREALHLSGRNVLESRLAELITTCLPSIDLVSFAN